MLAHRPILLLFALLAATPLSVAAQQRGPAYYGDGERGWHWYEQRPDPRAKPAPIKLPPQSVAPASPAPQKDPPLSTAWIRENLPRFRDKAIDEPTPDNVELYLYLVRLSMDKADRFTKATQVATFSNPALDQSQRSPMSEYGKQIAAQSSSAATTRILSGLARHAGIWFFLRSDCQFCHAQAPLLQRLQQRYGFEILPITLDGMPLQSGEFPDVVPDSGQGAKLGVQVTPTLYLVEQGGRILQISTGLQTIEEIEDRMMELGRNAGWISDADYNEAHAIHGGSLTAEIARPGAGEITDNPQQLLKYFRAAGAAMFNPSTSPSTGTEIPR